ncbi:M23 family metallopeptidase [Psychrosphaera sp.]|nr:M23 family metallopeptidase [Psychrosphaera sp.]
MNVMVIKRLLVVMTLLLGSANVNAVFSSNVTLNNARITLTGDVIQGGLLYGKSSQDIKGVTIDGVKVPVHPGNKLFVFGFGVDAQAQSKLMITYADGSVETHSLNVVQREYKVDRVNGVAQKYVSPPKSVLTRISSDSSKVKQAREKMSYRTDFVEKSIRPAEGRISGVYGSRRVFNGVPKRPHFGLDIAGPTGTKVIAPWTGKVVLAEPDLYYSGGTLIIDHGLGVTSTYIHLSKIDVKVGEEVRQGEKIAEIGATGRVTGPHLDWRLNWFNRRLDPALLLD